MNRQDQQIHSRKYVKVEGEDIFNITNFHHAKTLKQFAYFMHTECGTDAVFVTYKGKTYGTVTECEAHFDINDYYTQDYKDVDEVIDDINEGMIPEVIYSNNINDLITDSDLVEIDGLIYCKDGSFVTRLYNAKIDFASAKRLFNMYRTAYDKHVTIYDLIKSVSMECEGSYKVVIKRDKENRLRTVRELTAEENEARRKAYEESHSNDIPDDDLPF